MESSVLSLLLVQETPAASAAAGQVRMEQMPALKDKNYGKTRTVYVLCCCCCFLLKKKICLHHTVACLLAL